MCLGQRSYRPYRLFRASRETMASDPDGEQSDQSDNPVNSEVVMNCVAIFYEEGKGVGNYRKKKFPLFGKSRREEAGEIQGNR